MWLFLRCWQVAVHNFRGTLTLLIFGTDHAVHQRSFRRENKERTSPSTLLLNALSRFLSTLLPYNLRMPISPTCHYGARRCDARHYGARRTLFSIHSEAFRTANLAVPKPPKLVAVVQIVRQRSPKRDYQPRRKQSSILFDSLLC